MPSACRMRDIVASGQLGVSTRVSAVPMGRQVVHTVTSSASLVAAALRSMCLFTGRYPDKVWWRYGSCKGHGCHNEVFCRVFFSWIIIWSSLGIVFMRCSNFRFAYCLFRNCFLCWEIFFLTSFYKKWV